MCAFLPIYGVGWRSHNSVYREALTVRIQYDGDMGPFVESMHWRQDVVAFTAPATPRSDRHPVRKGHMTPEDPSVPSESEGIYACSIAISHANEFVGKG